jgi:hypothetical protein
MARLFLVLVEVRFTLLGFEPCSRCITCKIVAFDTDSAQQGALNWARQVKFDGIRDGAVMSFSCTLYSEEIGTIDCIAESVVIAH